jgi:hypothetical protein
MFDSLCFVAFEMVYVPKDAVTAAGEKLIVTLWEEGNRAGRGFLCGIELVVAMQQLCELKQTLALFHCVIKLFVNIQCFFY